MRATNPILFPGLFSTMPGVLRGFLHSFLRLNQLDELYLEARSREGCPFTQSVLDLLNVRISLSSRDIERMPKSGPVVVVANHPFGILDGVVLDSVLLQLRPDIRILTNELICVRELSERCIPVDVFADRVGAQTNLRSIRRALEWLRRGNGVAMFPAGEVSHWSNQQRRVTDPSWSNLAVRLARIVDAPVVPIYFAGGNSLTFQMAGIVHPRLRTARLPIELFNKRGCTVEVRIGTPMSARDLGELGSDQRATAYIRARVYMLKHRRTGGVTELPRRTLPLVKPAKPEPVAEETQGVADAIARLEKEGRSVLDTSGYAIYAERGDKIPLVMREIARLREMTFREVGEGTGRALDLDSFDPYYTHLVLWSKENATIAGSYRLAWTEDVLPEKGVPGLYTSTLFRYAPGFFARMGAAVELGRSFVRPEYQKDYAPLLLLWQAIARVVAPRPEAPVLFGAVSISAAYSEASRGMIVRFLREHSFRSDLAGLVVSRKPFRSRVTRESELRVVSECFQNVEDLPISDIEEQNGVPVLLRQYLRLGGRVAAFNVDRKFGNALDGLLVVDLRETAPKLLAKYMGAEASAAFLRQCPTGVPPAPGLPYSA